MSERRFTFPFMAIVGQEQMKKALILNVINPSIGGVLIRGEKGTAKSTAVRALAELLPARRTIIGCPFHCEQGNGAELCPYCLERLKEGEELKTELTPMRVVELPLSATEDRVAGTLDIEFAIKSGKKRFEPGILAAANGNILYVDEVNLLDDHLVDLLLDSAAMGINYIEREGVSFSHPSKFILVGTMNPEEGDLRPQLLDRFGLAADIGAETDIGQRMEVVKRRLSYDSDPSEFQMRYEGAQSELKGSIARAKAKIATMQVDEESLKLAVSTALHFEVEGHRADITLLRAAMATAALKGRTTIARDDFSEVAGLVLAHRMRRKPFEEAGIRMEGLVEWFKTP